jgi:hypothetical protein
MMIDHWYPDEKPVLRFSPLEIITFVTIGLASWAAIIAGLVWVFAS